MQPDNTIQPGITCHHRLCLGVSAFFVTIQFLALIQIAYTLHNRLLYPHAVYPKLIFYLVILSFFAVFFVVLNRSSLAILRPLPFLWVGLAAVWNTVLFFAKGLLYTTDGLWISLANLPLFLLLILPVWVTTWQGYVFFKLCHPLFFRLKQKNRTILHMTVFAALQLTILSVYFLAYYPGNMSYDTYNQWSQIQGIIPYTTWHPIAHTLTMQLLLSIWNDLTIIAVAQILFYVLVTTLFAGELLKSGVRPIILYVLLIFFAATPNMGINLMTLWKDIPFTVGLLWATLILYKMLTRPNYFARLSHIFEFSFCMLIISLYRYNGILAFAFTCCYAVVYLRHKNKTIKRNGRIALAITLSVVILIMGPIPKLLEADPNPSGMKLRPIFQGLGAMYQAEQEDKLTPEIQALMESFATPEEWKQHYDPYFSDVYIWYIPDIIGKYSTVSTGTALQAYVQTFITQPDVILGDRLNLGLLSWSVAADPYSYDNRFTTIIEAQIVEEFGVMRPDNAIAPKINHLAKRTYEIPLLDVFVWRIGIYSVLLTIAAAYCLSTRRRAILLYIPLVSNWLIVFLTMPAQDYRYVWFIFMICPFLLLALLSFTRYEVVSDEIS